MPSSISSLIMVGSICTDSTASQLGQLYDRQLHSTVDPVCCALVGTILKRAINESHFGHLLMKLSLRLVGVVAHPAYRSEGFAFSVRFHALFLGANRPSTPFHSVESHV